MNKIHVLSFANAFALVDIIIHTISVLWISFFPDSFLFLLRYFVEGIKIEMDPSLHLNSFDFFFGTALEVSFFWVLGAFLAIFYNFFLRKSLKK